MISDKTINIELNEEFTQEEKQANCEISTAERNAEIERVVLELSRDMVTAQRTGGRKIIEAARLRSKIKFIIGDYEQYKNESCQNTITSLIK